MLTPLPGLRKSDPKPAARKAQNNPTHDVKPSKMEECEASASSGGKEEKGQVKNK